MIYQLFNSFDQYHYHFSLYKNYNYIMHLHEYFEVVFVFEGELSMTVNNKTEVLHENDVALVLPNQIHSYKSENSNVWIALFSADLVSKFASDMKNKTGKDFIFSVSEDSLHCFLENIYKENFQNIYELKSFLYMICANYYSQIKTVKISERAAYTSIHSIIEYVSTNYMHAITLKEIAEKFGYNKNYLSRYFNNQIGTNFKTFVNEFRIENAKNLLLETNKNITEISELVGFESIRNFNRVFLTSTKMTPTQFKISFQK